MERLTKYSNDIIRNKAINIIRKLSERNGLNGDELAVVSAFCLIERTENRVLKEYEDLEEQNRLLKLPCVVGDMTYGVNKSMRWITDAIVKKIEIDADGIWVITSSGIFSVEDFEKTVFLTKEEAEAALKELERG